MAKIKVINLGVLMNSKLAGTDILLKIYLMAILVVGELNVSFNAIGAFD